MDTPPWQNSIPIPVLLISINHNKSLEDHFQLGAIPLCLTKSFVGPKAVKAALVAPLTLTATALPTDLLTARPASTSTEAVG